MASGRQALVPESAQEGDIIAALEGNGRAANNILHYLSTQFNWMVTTVESMIGYIFPQKKLVKTMCSGKK
jgi:hypothetical protein